MTGGVGAGGWAIGAEDEVGGRADTADRHAGGDTAIDRVAVTGERVEKLGAGPRLP
jgi:hypothetical protein